MKKSAHLVIGAIVFALAASVGIAQAKPIEVTLWHAQGGGNRLEALMEIVDGFNASQSDYAVKASHKGNYAEVMNQTIAAYRAKKQPHIVQVYEVGTLTMMKSNAIVPVEALMKDAGYTVDWDDFLQPILSYYRSSESKLQSMPFNSSTPVFFWNKDLYKKAGLTSPPKTWQELGKQMTKLRAAGVECGYATATDLWVHVENYSAVNDQPLGTKANGLEGLDAELVINKTRVVGHYKRLKQWLDDGRAQFFGRQEKRGQHKAFFSGRCATVVLSTAWQGTLERDATFEWGAAPLLHESDLDRKNSTIGGATFWTLKGHNAEEYKGVAAFFSYLATPDVQIAYSKATGYVPVTTSAYAKMKAEGFFKEKPGREVPILSLKWTPTTKNSWGTRFGNWVQARKAIGAELENALAGTKTVEQAFNDAVRRGNESLRQFEKQYE